MRKREQLKVVLKKLVREPGGKAGQSQGWGPQKGAAGGERPISVYRAQT